MIMINCTYNRSITDRTFYLSRNVRQIECYYSVNYKQAFSEGVPQGAVLLPHLFRLCVI